MRHINKSWVGWKCKLTKRTAKSHYHNVHYSLFVCFSFSIWFGISFIQRRPVCEGHCWSCRHSKVKEVMQWLLCCGWLSMVTSVGSGLPVRVYPFLSHTTLPHHVYKFFFYTIFLKFISRKHFIIAKTVSTSDFLDFLFHVSIQRIFSDRGC